jgi:hypothetical protein
MQINIVSRECWGKIMRGRNLSQKRLLSLGYALAVALNFPQLAVAEPKDNAKPVANPIDVGWVPLLANPAAFDGKLIEIRGWFTVYLANGYTAFRIYMSEDALKYEETTLGLCVDEKSLVPLLPEPREIWQTFNHDRVWIRGVFHATPPTPERPFGYPGTIDKIEIFQQTKPGTVWSPMPKEK